MPVSSPASPPSDPLCRDADIALTSRRSFLGHSAHGLGGIALATLLNPTLLQGASPSHHTPAAKRVIYLFQSGGPPHLDLLDPKPQLDRRHGQEVPASILQGQRLTGMTAGQSSFPVARSIFRFAPFGQAGLTLNADLLPNRKLQLSF